MILIRPHWSKTASIRSVVRASVLLLGLVVFPSTALSAQVIKVKGRRAIVEFEPGEKPFVGQQLEAQSTGRSDRAVRSASSSARPRDYLLGFTGELSFLSRSDDSESEKSIGTNFRFGWNHEEFEYGPTGEFSYSSQEFQTRRVLGVGGFVDFNFEANRPGIDLIFGIGAEGAVSQGVVSTATRDDTAGLITLQGGPFVKWFPFQVPVAIRADAVFTYLMHSRAARDYSESGVKVKGGLAVYF
jgi:hypothetical protein